jgi:hypothetical protein
MVSGEVNLFLLKIILDMPPPDEVELKGVVAGHAYYLS